MYTLAQAIYDDDTASETTAAATDADVASVVYIRIGLRSGVVSRRCAYHSSTRLLLLLLLQPR